MSIVIIGGNECMERRYIDTCKEYGCKAKIFTKMKGEIRSKIGNPDLIILFTNTVSHKMVACANCEAKRCKARVERVHSSSLCSLKGVLERHALAGA